MKVAIENIEVGFELPPFSAPVATGMTSTFYANQLLTDFFGEDWLRGGSLATKYIAPMYFGETITCKARVIGKTEEQAGYRLDMTHFLCFNTLDRSRIEPYGQCRATRPGAGSSPRRSP